MSVEMGPPLKAWLRPKQQRFFQRYGYASGWVAARVTKGRRWWELDDHLAAAAAAAGNRRVGFLGGWYLVPEACVADALRRLSVDTHRLQVRRLAEAAS